MNQSVDSNDFIRMLFLDETEPRPDREDLPSLRSSQRERNHNREPEEHSISLHNPTKRRAFQQTFDSVSIT